MSDLYYVFIMPKAGVSRDQVERELNAAEDWIRYQDRFYIIETKLGALAWKNRLKSLVDPNGHLFICRLDPKKYEGWMSKVFWEWWQPKSKAAVASQR